MNIINLSDDFENQLLTYVNDPKQLETLEVLGKGDSARVYRLGKFALKYFDAEFPVTADPEALLKLQDSLYYPKLYAYEDGRYLLTELIEGNTLLELASNGYPFNEDWEIHLKSALELAFSRNIYLYDISCSNIIIRDNIPVIVDVGDFETDKDHIVYPLNVLLEALIISYNQC